MKLPSLSVVILVVVLIGLVVIGIITARKNLVDVIPVDPPGVGIIANETASTAPVKSEIAIRGERVMVETAPLQPIVFVVIGMIIGAAIVWITMLVGDKR